jgi:plasmid stabilization system protein ParE
MPSEWSRKRERQYEHIKDRQQRRGVPPRRAREIAARTVNKQRRKAGETPNKTTQGTGNPNRALDQRSKRELYNRARELRISGRSHMTKDELVHAIRQQT